MSISLNLLNWFDSHLVHMVHYIIVMYRHHSSFNFLHNSMNKVNQIELLMEVTECKIIAVKPEATQSQDDLKTYFTCQTC